MNLNVGAGGIRVKDGSRDITTRDSSKPMNNRYRIAIRVGNSLSDSVYCSYPFGGLCIRNSELILKCRPFREILLPREHVISFEVKRSLLCRFIRIRHNDNSLPTFIDVYFLHNTDKMFDKLMEWRNRVSV